MFVFFKNLWLHLKEILPSFRLALYWHVVSSFLFLITAKIFWENILWETNNTEKKKKRGETCRWKTSLNDEDIIYPELPRNGVLDISNLHILEVLSHLFFNDTNFIIYIYICYIYIIYIQNVLLIAPSFI